MLLISFFEYRTRYVCGMLCKANKIKCELESFFNMLVMLPIGILIRLFIYAPLLLLHEIAFFFSPLKELIKEDLQNFRQWPELMCSAYLSFYHH